MTAENARFLIIERLKQDFIGPSGGENEQLDELPSDRYLTGILYPLSFNVEQNDDEVPPTEGGSTNKDGNEEKEVGLSKSIKPTTAGLSFAVNTLDSPKLELHISSGAYVPFWQDSEGNTYPSKERPKVNADIKLKLLWKREQRELVKTIEVLNEPQRIDLSDDGLAGIGIFLKTNLFDSKRTITVQAYNTNKFGKDSSLIDREGGSFFQFSLTVKPISPTHLVPRPVIGVVNDEDASISALIYRDTKEYAVGHTCAAEWKEVNGYVDSVMTEWLPTQEVKSVDSKGDPIFFETLMKAGLTYPDADYLAKKTKDECLKTLSVFVAAFAEWLDKESLKIDSLPKQLQTQALANIDNAKNVSLLRMKAGLQLLESDPIAFQAFQLANQSMQLQMSWKSPDVLSWRPFQLAFGLMNLKSITDKEDVDRSTMDLIWFPTGGGKTEAYLLLTSFTLFYRRLISENPDDGAGVAAFMRYTLRTLTVQQFERAAALITACESIRLTNSKLLGTKRFSIGLWVGGDTTPNDFNEAFDAIEENNEYGSTPIQIKKCPVCSGRLKWLPNKETKRIKVSCEKCFADIPVLTVDHEIYEELPSLVIGTIDKFAQVARNPDAVKLFGIGSKFSPPDLIIQDELHLISGPLGTIAALYEVAIDKLCEDSKGFRPKIIGSTATIRRAREQIKSLFNRNSHQFPPPIIDANNSCFAKLDETKPGRQYVGLTTAGRSAKFTLQAAAASLLQSSENSSMPEVKEDPYSTLVCYFNSLRILGGALVVMQDDVEQTLKAYAGRRNHEEKRQINAVEEMTSRKTSKEIPEILDRLSHERSSPDYIDVLLATNMLSVGVDIPRLGLMLVNGQPKTMSEYIQATSRVGRSSPGLVVTLYNNLKIRDRAHYESFKTWHQSLYRDLEGSSVTPFAARARDKALHAVVVMLARNFINDMKSNPTLTSQKRSQVEEKILPMILQRIKEIDPHEIEDSKYDLDEILDKWEKRGPLTQYWGTNASGKKSLLTGAEDNAQLTAFSGKASSAFPTPNSMRNVEAQTSFFLKEYPRPYAKRINPDE